MVVKLKYLPLNTLPHYCISFTTHL